MTTPDPKALRAIARDATQEWSAKVSEIHEGAEGDAYGFAAFGPTHDYEGDEERHEEAQDQAEADARYIAAVSPPVVLALLDRIEAAERDRDRLRDDAQRLVDGWRAEADRARATGLTIEAVRGLVEAWDRTDISFSRLVEDLRTLAMVRAETAEREAEGWRLGAETHLERIRAAEERVRELEHDDEQTRAALAHHAALLVPLQAVAEAARARCRDAVPQWAPELRAALAALDAAKVEPEVVDGECQQDCDALGVPCPKRAAKEGRDSFESAKLTTGEFNEP